MAIRQIVKIDEDKCNGCGECIVNCPEGALAIVDGKARIVRESYCDGLGACVGTCPEGALVIEQREAEAFDEQAVEARMASASEAQQAPEPATKQCNCPGAAVRQIDFLPASGSPTTAVVSQLSHWPVQLTLVPPTAPFLQGADLLLVADCVPFAMADFHGRLLRGRPVVVGCPKLDNPESYVAKLTDLLFEQSSIRSLTIVHMEVPCCSGLCSIARAAMQAARREIPAQEVTVSVNGRVVDEQDWR